MMLQNLFGFHNSFIYWQNKIARTRKNTKLELCWHGNYLNLLCIIQMNPTIYLITVFSNLEEWILIILNAALWTSLRSYPCVYCAEWLDMTVLPATIFSDTVCPLLYVLCSFFFRQTLRACLFTVRPLETYSRRDINLRLEGSNHWRLLAVICERSADKEVLPYQG